MCELLREPSNGEAALSEADRRLIATKFFVGGASFNSLLSTPEDSRRIEFKLEFKSRSERREDLARPDPGTDEVALAAALDPKERCPILDRPGT